MYESQYIDYQRFVKIEFQGKTNFLNSIFAPLMLKTLKILLILKKVKQ
jgi:hypothetical protein